MPIGDVDATESTPEHVMRKLRDGGSSVGTREEVDEIIRYRVTLSNNNAPKFFYFYTNVAQCRKIVSLLSHEQ